MGLMGAVVVYESMFGNTRRVAQAVAEGIREVMPADVVEVGEAAAGDRLDADLLVVGAPTHAFGLSKPTTRADAEQRAGQSVISRGRGVREWLEDGWRTSAPAAAFDTHTQKPNLPGHAGKAVDKRLRRAGCRVLERYESFAVHGYEGPLCDGEVDRARAWGTHLASLVVGGSPVRA
jgi:hypothetical protein